MKNWIILLISIITCLKVFSQETHTWIYEVSQEPREHPVNMTHLNLTVSFNPYKGQVFGKVIHTFIPLRDKVDSIYLDAPEIEILKVNRGLKSLQWKIRDQGVWIYADSPFLGGKIDSIAIEYQCTPKKGIYFIGWNDSTARSRKQIWTQGQGIDNRYWIPMYDDMNDKVITETHILFDAKYQVLSNGNLISKKSEKNNSNTWHYKMDHPHAPYLLMIGIGEYQIEKRVTKSGTPVNLWYYPEHPERVKPTYLYSTECIEFLEEQTGIPYPWKSYSQIPVQDFVYGAMENTTATVFGDFLWVDDRMFIDRNYIGTNVHELTHQWFGDYITARSARHTWLQESFATYYPKKFMQKIYGEDYYEWQLRNEHNSALKASEKDLLPVLHSHAGSSRWYPKGSAIIDMMAYTFGENEFKRVIHHYLKKYAYQSVETQDLYKSFQDTLGLSPFWFFDQWLYRGGEPHYQLNWKILGNGRDNELQLFVSQLQPQLELTGLFQMPVKIEINYKDGSRELKEILVSKKDECFSFNLENNKEVSFVLFDPGSRILKKLTYNRSWDQLKAQASAASHMIDRYDALVEMRNISLSEKLDFLHQRYAQEKFHAMKTEILKQIKLSATEASWNIRKQAVTDKSVEVRAAVWNEWPEWKSEHWDYVSIALKDSAASVITAVLENAWIQFPEKHNLILQLTGNWPGPAHKLEILKLELSLRSGDTAAIPKLVDLASPGFEFITRQNAMDALKRSNILTQDLILSMFEGVGNANFKLSSVCEQTLSDYSRQTKWLELIKSVYHNYATSLELNPKLEKYK